MDQPGVEVRPIVNIAGHSHFNEVFFSDARVPKENVIGQVNGGWAVAMTLLGYERGFGATTTYFRYRAELDRLVAMAQERGRTAEDGIRQKLAWCHSKVEIMRWLTASIDLLLKWRAPRSKEFDRKAELERISQNCHGAVAGYSGRRRNDPRRRPLLRCRFRSRRCWHPEYDFGLDQ